MHRLGVVLASIAMAAVPVSAASMTHSFGQPGDIYAAEATFATQGNQLIVTLTNTSDQDIAVPSEVLTAVLFDVNVDPSDAPELSPVRAELPPGTEVYYGGAPADGDVSGEWAYRHDAGGIANGMRYGISSTGLDDIFGPDDLFDPDGDITPPASPDGLQWGIVPEGDVEGTANGGVKKEPLIKNSVVFTLDVLDPFFPVDKVENVYFRYGTSLGQPYFASTTTYHGPLPSPNSVPEPLTMVGVFAAAGALGGYVRRRR